MCSHRRHPPPGLFQLPQCNRIHWMAPFPAPLQPPETLVYSPSECDYFRYPVYAESHSICHLASGLVHVAQWLQGPSMCSMCQRFIPFGVGQCSIVWMYQFCSLIHPLMHIWIDAAMDTGIQVPLTDPTCNSFGYVSRSGLLDYTVVLFLCL